MSWRQTYERSCSTVSADAHRSDCRISPPRAWSNRQPNLDLLRATAILGVVIYHVAQMAPQQLSWLTRITEPGKYGVDLFFVLSGWLIGGLYWRELATFGNIQLRQFWLRRWMRTIPPYLAALGLAWPAVFFTRGEAFDFGYLVFFQNYYRELPFFLVSWSLCVEEHFYLVFPMLLMLCSRVGISHSWLFLLLLLGAPAGRWLMSSRGLDPGFGLAQTATHLRMEGLLLGFWVAGLPYHDKNTWRRLKDWSPLLLLFAFGFLAIVPCLSPLMMYRIGLTLVPVALTLILAFVVNREPFWVARLRMIKWIALASYSIYLTHSLLIHLARLLVESLAFDFGLAYYVLAACAIGSGGMCFYLLFERTSLWARERWAPRRAHNYALAFSAQPRIANSKACGQS